MPDKVAVIAKITVRPEAADEVEAVLRTLTEATAEEDGTVEHILNREGDSGSFWFYEVYDDQAAFDAHGQNPALPAAFKQFGNLLGEPPELHILTPVLAKRLPL